MKPGRIGLGAVLLSLSAHMFCCILPAVVALVNLTLGTEYAFGFEIMSYNAETVLLVLSGIVLVATYVWQKRHRALDSLLYISAAIYAATLILHIFEE
ncbi:MAG: hypothetical protein LBL52_00920 [Rickettsiales bacterium]|jgi:hypothetical protein|nr:hypothetical protein [Rickettsiales bacterium]